MRSIIRPNGSSKKMAGYNTDVTHQGVTFHVQTEDKGLNTHYIESIIYKSGKALTSRKSSYISFLGSPALKEKIKQLLEEQHNTILKEISEGKFDHF